MAVTPFTRHSNGHTPDVYAHRGDRSRARDNTLDAFTLAAEAGADGIELDVRMTVDHVLVVHHDADLPDGHAVTLTSYSEVVSRHPHVPTLDQALRAIPAIMGVNVEIKSDARGTDTGATHLLVDRVVATIRDQDAPSRILFSSFDPTVVAYAAEVAADIRRGLLIVDAVPLAVGITLAHHVSAHTINVPGGVLRGNPHDGLAFIADNGLDAVVWDIHDADEIRAVRSADMIIVDDPSFARATLASSPPASSS